MDEVLRITPDEISFAIRPGELCRVTCEYTNLESVPLAYNVRTTNTDLYCVRLNKDIIQPGETKSVVFIRRAFESVPNDLVCKDRFQVLVLKLDTPELAHSTADEVWKGRKKYDFQRKFPVKLCVDSEPPSSLDNPRDSLMLDSFAHNGDTFSLGQLPSAAPELPSMPSALLPSGNSVAIQKSPPLAPNSSAPPQPSTVDLVPRTATGTVLPFGDSFTAVRSDGSSLSLPPQQPSNSSAVPVTSSPIPPLVPPAVSSTARPSVPSSPSLPPTSPLQYHQVAEEGTSRTPLQGSKTATNVQLEVERLAQVEPEVESAAVTAAAASARIRAEQAEFRASLSQKSLSSNGNGRIPVRTETSVANDPAPARVSHDTSSTSGIPARVDSTVVGSTHPFFGDRVPSPPASDEKSVPESTQKAPEDSGPPLSGVTEEDDGDVYAQAEAVTTYTPSAADEDRKRELDERRRVAAEEEARRLEEERLRAEAAAKARAEEIARKAREAELERVRTRRQVETARAAPRPQIPVLEGARAQRAAVDRACALHRMIGEREREIARLTRELVEARHKLSNARIGAAPLHDTIYETDPAARITIAQVAIMAALSGALLTLFL